MNETFRHSTENRDGIILFRFAGPLDASSELRVREIFAAGISKRISRVVVDLTDVGFADSSGIGTLISLHKRMSAQGGQLALAGLGGQPRNLVALLGLEFVVRCCETPAEAIEVLAGIR